MTAESLELEIEQEGREERYEQLDVETSSRLRDGVADEMSGADPKPRPHDGARRAAEEEAGDAQLRGTSQSGGDCVQLRQKSGPQLKGCDVGVECPPRATD